MPVELPWRFPSEAAQIAAEGERFQRLSSRERAMRIMRLVDEGRRLLATVPNRDAQRALRERDEDLWRQRILELVAQHQSR